MKAPLDKLLNLVYNLVEALVLPWIFRHHLELQVSPGKLSEMWRWLNTNVGKSNWHMCYGQSWTVSFYFRNRDDLVLFALRWA